MAHAVVLACSRIGGQYRETAGTDLKALVPIRGRPVLSTVLEALAGSRQIEEIVVVGPEDLREQVPAPQGITWVTGGEDVPESLRRGLRRLGLSVPVVVASAGLPFLTAEMVDALVTAHPRAVDVVLPAIRSEEFRRAFPAAPVAEVRFRDGWFALPGVMSAKPQALLMNQSLLEGVFRVRARPIRAASLLLGRMAGVRYVLGSLSLSSAAMRATRRLGAPVLPVMGLAPELAFLLTEVEHFRAAQALAEQVAVGRQSA